MKLTNDGVKASAAQTHILSKPVEDRLDTWVAMNITDWQIPSGDTHWSDFAYTITEDCMVRDQIKSASDPMAEYLRLSERQFSFYRINTFYAEAAFYALQDGGKSSPTSAAQQAYDSIMSQPSGSRGDYFDSEVVDGDSLIKMCEIASNRIYESIDDWGVN
jgi:hypothetical protein